MQNQVRLLVANRVIGHDFVAKKAIQHMWMEFPVMPSADEVVQRAKRAGRKLAARGDVEPFLAMDVLRDAHRRAAQGQDICHLEVGQPAASAPRAVLEAARAALDGDRLGYTEATGIPELRERIAGLLAGENQRLDREVRARTIELSSLASYLTNAREAEQAHLARELHDELGALLTAAKLDADWIARKLPQEVREHLDTRISRLQHTLSEGIALKRRIIDDLRPPLLKDLGLIAALKALLEDFAIDGEPIVHTDLPDENTPGLPPEQSLALFRIAQESLTNIRKYAAAKNVWVSLRLDAGVAHLEVRDDGCGFSGAALPAASRHGLAGMKHRVQSHAGKFELQTAPGQGTRISARIPLDPPQRDATAA